MSTKLSAAKIKEAITENKGMPLSASTQEGKGEKAASNGTTFSGAKSSILADLPGACAQLDLLRKGDKDNLSVDISFAEFVKDKWGFAPTELKLANGETMLVAESFFQQLGINPNQQSVASLMTLGEIDGGYRWIVPEIFRDAIRLGLRKSPIYPSLIRTEESVNQTMVTMPDIKMPSMTPKKVGELETISKGRIQFGSKSVKIAKMGKGFDLSDESVRYTTLNFLSIALEATGILFGLGFDTMFLDTMINGDQDDGSDSTAVIGSISGNSVTYKDILRVWVRMGRIGRLPNAMVSDEAIALDVLDLNEFKSIAGNTGNPTTHPGIQLRTPVPQSQDYYVHGAVPDSDYILFLNKDFGAVKLNATALRVESERTASRQMDSFYITQTTGFATLMRDARLILDRSVAFSGAGFPSWMDIDTAESITIS